MVFGATDWEHIHLGLRRPEVTMKSLWLKSRHERGYSDSYQRFRLSYRRWLSHLNIAMQWQHECGERMFAGYVDVADSYVVDPGTGEAWPTCLFLAVLASSGYCYVELCVKKDIDNWIGDHVRALQFFGGTTKRLVPKLADEVSYLSKHVRYLDLMRRCYTTIEVVQEPNAFLKADCRKQSVFRMVACWLVVSLRHHLFTGVGQTNEGVQQLIADLNNRPFKKLPGSSRKTWFETVERRYLTALPSMPGDREFWLGEDVTSSYINVDKHYYSVPVTVIGQHVDVKVTPEFVEIFFQGRQITSHKRKDQPGRSTAKAEHLSASGKTDSGWSDQRVRNWAEKIGPATSYLIDTILTRSNCSPAGIRSCLGLLTLESAYGGERLESACRYAVSLKSWTVSSISLMLKRGLDQSHVQLPIPGLIHPRKSSRARKHP
jgi:hypothetical protein